MTTSLHRPLSRKSKNLKRSAGPSSIRNHLRFEREVYKGVHYQANSFDAGSLMGFCRQSLQFLVGKFKASRAAIFVLAAPEEYYLVDSCGFASAQVNGVSYRAALTPFWQKLQRGRPFVCSRCGCLLEAGSDSTGLGRLELKLWLPLVVPGTEHLLGFIGIDREPVSDYQRSIADAWCSFGVRVLNCALNDMQWQKQVRDGALSSVCDRLQRSLHTLRFMTGMRCRHLDEVYDNLIELFTENFSMKRLMLVVRQRDNSFSVVRSVGIDSLQFNEPVQIDSDSAFSRLLCDGRLFRLPLSYSLPQINTSTLMESCVCSWADMGLNYFVPFVTNDESRLLMGFVGLHLEQYPGDYHALMSRHISTLAAITLHNVQLNLELQDTRERYEHQINKLQMLYDVGQALSVIDNRTDLLKKILGHATDIVNAEKGSVMLLNDKHRLEVNVVKGIDEGVAEKILHGEIPTTSLALGEGIAGTVAQTGVPMLINDVSSIEGGQAQENGDVKFVTSRTSHVSSILCVPLRAHNEVIGVINITNKKHGQGFTEDDKRIVEQVADQAAVAIHNARLYELATTDSLTKVYVRHQLFLRLENELRRLGRSRERLSVTIIMIDIDFFKSINDRFGHPYGDKVLVAVTKTVRNTLRAVDSICRYGGEEFCMILPDTDIAGGKIVSRRITRLLEKLDLCTDDGTQVRVSVSGGIASCRNYEFVEPDNPHSSYRITPIKATVSDLINQVDIALYYSKQHGRNRFTSYHDICSESAGQMSADVVCTCRQDGLPLHCGIVQSAECDATNNAHAVKYESDMRR